MGFRIRLGCRKQSKLEVRCRMKSSSQDQDTWISMVKMGIIKITDDGKRMNNDHLYDKKYSLCISDLLATLKSMMSLSPSTQN